MKRLFITDEGENYEVLVDEEIGEKEEVTTPEEKSTLTTEEISKLKMLLPYIDEIVAYFNKDKVEDDEEEEGAEEIEEEPKKEEILIDTYKDSIGKIEKKKSRDSLSDLDNDIAQEEIIKAWKNRCGGK